ncbi:hypothetical protein [Pseudotabrizicola sp. 4114]|uniref:hypothetical protein n=1 Tax=Pseudotabrizicola sp. 4114 TaxID=2817731 RepID=UPI00285C456B|nr:hypothetical protein [Pseudorhodobacter sp. 4114]
MTAPETPPIFQSLRLFPKLQGANAYAITGIAAQCDWVLLSDARPPFTHLHRARPTDAPRHIFLSLRNPFSALAHFATEVLPNLHMPFVLVSGSEDCTLPQQCDRRWRAYTAAEQQMIATILDHPLLLRWFAENLEDDSDPRFSPLPTGMVYPGGVPETLAAVSCPPLHSRPLKVLCGHRVRNGAQWELRRAVTERAANDWADFCTVPDGELPEPEFLALMRSHAFVLCAEGGGLDPSPKAWQAILSGAIPIVRKTGTYKAYAQLPVAFVDDWHSESLSPAKLSAWRESFAPYQDPLVLRGQTLERLGLAYWWDQIKAAARPQQKFPAEPCRRPGATDVGQQDTLPSLSTRFWTP